MTKYSFHDKCYLRQNICLVIMPCLWKIYQLLFLASRAIKSRASKREEWSAMRTANAYVLINHDSDKLMSEAGSSTSCGLDFIVLPHGPQASVVNKQHISKNLRVCFQEWLISVHRRKFTRAVAAWIHRTAAKAQTVQRSYDGEYNTLSSYNPSICYPYVVQCAI